MENMSLSATTLPGQRRQVYSGKASKTKSGLSKSSLTKSKTGKIVSKKKSALGKKIAAKNGFAKWRSALKKACSEHGKNYYIPRKSDPVYKKAKKMYEEMKGKSPKKNKSCSSARKWKTCVGSKKKVKGCSWNKNRTPKCKKMKKKSKK